MYHIPISRIPRFGHGSEISKLASSKREEQRDYVVGILAVSFFIISLFIIWAAAVVACKRMGKQRVGLCAGEVRVQCDEKGRVNIPAYLWAIRCTFIFFGCCMFVLCMALAGPGLASTKTASNSIRKLSRDVNELITEGMLILDSVERVKWSIDKLDVQSILMVGEACPNSKYMNGILSASTIEGIDEDFDRLKEQIQNIDLEGIRHYVDFVVDGTDHVEIAVTTFEENDWIVKMSALLLGGLTLFMTLAACSAGSGIHRYIPALTWMLESFILPTFVLANICCWVATSALAFASIFNSDFCSGNTLQSGPAGTLMNFFEERGISSNDVIYRAFTYYQSGCTTDDPIIPLYQYEDYLQSGIRSASFFLAKVKEVGIVDMNDACGAERTPLIEGITLINNNLELLSNALRSTLELASCSKMRPVYMAFEDVACTDSQYVFVLTSTNTFLLSFIGMIMVTLRAGMYLPKRGFSSSSSEEEGNGANALARGIEFGSAIDAASAEPLTPSMPKANRLTRVNLYNDEECLPLSPPDAKFLALLGDKSTEDPESAITSITARSNSLCGVDLTFSTLSSKDFGPDEEDRSPMTPRKLWLEFERYDPRSTPLG